MHCCPQDFVFLYTVHCTVIFTLFKGNKKILLTFLPGICCWIWNNSVKSASFSVLRFPLCEFKRKFLKVLFAILYTLFFSSLYCTWGSLFTLKGNQSQAIKSFFKTLQCASHCGVRLRSVYLSAESSSTVCNVHHTAESDSAVCIPPWSQALRFASQCRVKLRSVHHTAESKSRSLCVSGCF